ncbi:hypothetical protein A3715_06875 [Oleiphilus sp. HI0009]|nr:tetratricopeptide repeat protein [Oleiphilus sp. HI0067]KZX81718.1 hypothetical protein A3715_06875 [Oleiphilus sp. HI0009]KZY70408.1 hypothetical protein A3739_06930 [Oleiphilus sp. HI0067]
MTINPSNVFAEALTNYQRGQYQKTAQLLNTLLQANIASPDIFNLMASALFRLGDRDNAKKLYLASLKMKPDYAQTHVHAAGFYRQISELDLATQHYVKAFELDQNDRESLMNAALVLQQLERWEASEEVIERYIDAFGVGYEVLIRKSVCRYSLYDYDEAEALIEKAELINPDQVMTQYYRAQVYDKTNRKVEADRLFSNLIAQGHEPSKFSLSLLCFSIGDWDRAFELYENRPVALWLKQYCESNGACYWDGASDLKNKHVLVYAEQGLGDQIRYAYFIKRLVAEAKKVSIIYDARLYPVIQHMYPDVECLATESLTPEILHDVSPEFCLCVGSLGLRYSDGLYDSKLLEDGFFSYEGDQSDLPVKDSSKPIIGLCWRSIKILKERNEWYCTAQEFAQMLSGIEATFISLQYGLSDEEREAFRSEGLELIELYGIDLKDDQASLAHIISQLDSVVSVSTAMSELAGACGVPVLTLAIENIRWFMAEKHVSGFYPKSRMYYKKMFGTWDEALSRLRSDLIAEDCERL